MTQQFKMLTNSLIGLAMLGTVHAMQVNCTSDMMNSTHWNEMTCQEADGLACATTCDRWCTMFCGAGQGYSCQSNSGTLCAMQHLSDIHRTCERVREIEEWFAPRWEEQPPTEIPSEYATIPRSQECDNHAYCTFCENSTSCKEVIHYGEMYLQEHGLNLKTGPAAMALVSRAGELCKFLDEVGFLSHNVTTNESFPELAKDFLAENEGAPATLEEAKEADKSSSDQSRYLYFAVVAGGPILFLTFLGLKRLGGRSKPGYVDMTEERNHLLT